MNQADRCAEMLQAVNDDVCVMLAEGIYLEDDWKAVMASPSSTQKYKIELKEEFVNDETKPHYYWAITMSADKLVKSFGERADRYTFFRLP